MTFRSQRGRFGHRPVSRTAGVAALSCFAAVLAGCGGGGGLSADSSCRGYLASNASSRHDLAVRLSALYKVPDAGNPMWGLNLDYVCGQNPNQTLKEYFSRTGTAAAATTEPAPVTQSEIPSAVPSLTPSASAVPSPAPSAVPSVTASAVPSAVPSASTAPTYEPVPVDLSSAAGSTVFSTDQENLVCSGSNLGSLGAAQLLPKAQLLLTCETGEALVDISSGKVLWYHTSADGDSDLVYGGPHLFYAATTVHPAEGLTAEFVTRDLVALDGSTGATAWSKPLEASLPKNDQSNFSLQSVTETVGGPAPHPDEVVVQGSIWSAFDAATGAALWHKADLGQQQYVGYDLGLVRDDSSGTLTWTATRLTTGKTAWSKPEPSLDGHLAIDGAVATQLSDQGILQVNVRSGATLLNRVFPATWQNPLISPPYAVNFDGKKLSLFNISNPSKALWSVSSDEVTPLLVTPSFVEVQAQSGRVVLDLKNGSIRTDVTLPQDLPDHPDLTDGLMLFGDQSVYELTTPTP